MKKIFLSILVLFFFATQIKAQETAAYTNELEAYYHAVDLYHGRAYVASQHLFNEVKKQFDDSSEMRANCDYYAANCAIRLGERNADDLMQDFVDKYPNSTKRNNAFLEVANYYYENGKYTFALKWLKKVKTNGMPRGAFENYLFKYGYSLFSTKNHTASKKFFVQLLDSPKYGAQAKYYYGFIAYQQDDYDNADKYLTEVSKDKIYKKDVSYYMADMNFKLGKFQKAIDVALPLLASARRNEKSEINKIIGESYFNLGQYDKAIPYLKNYKGKRNKWVNTDYYLLGYSYYKQQQYEDAVSNFNKIIDGKNAVAQNAFYHLAECYLKTGQKSEALNAFRNASQMDFKPKMQEDAYLNYAKLSYEIGNPYKSVPEVLQDFLIAYPNSLEKDTINNLIISAYITSKDYKGALSYLEHGKIKNKKQYQQVAYLRGAQLFIEKKYQEAITYFDKSLSQSVEEKLTAKATYWKGESNYQLQQFDKAYSNYLNFKEFSASSSCEENKQVDYQIAYVLFKQKKYKKAASHFDTFLNSNPTDETRKNDAYLRLGDMYFVTSRYQKAVAAYTKSEGLNTKKKDYAIFQKAISYGFLKKNTKKISLLNQVINSYPKSIYRDDALYVLASTHTASNKTAKALAAYDRLLQEHPRSSLVPRTLLKKGLIYYNNNENDRALQVYKQAVKNYPNTVIAQEAVRNARQIYVDIGRVDEYATWVKDLDFVNVSNADLDNDMYESAEKQYTMNAYSKAISAFKKYLQNFPKGLHTLQAHFYLAQAYESQNKNEKTIPHYSYIVEHSQNEYSEQSLTRLSQVYLTQKKWDKATPLLLQLEQIANQSQNLSFAQSNLMKAYYNKENYTKAVSYAEKVINQGMVDNKVLSDAKIIIARSAIETEDYNKARSAYQEVATIATGELKAESLYYDAYFKHQDGDYNNSNTVVQKIASNYAAYKYWGAKALIVMAKNYYKLNDAYQATYILDSVIKNFDQFDNVVEEAKAELKRIKTEEAKTNDSVIPE